MWKSLFFISRSNQYNIALDRLAKRSVFSSSTLIFGVQEVTFRLLSFQSVIAKRSSALCNALHCSGLGDYVTASALCKSDENKCVNWIYSKLKHFSNLQLKNFFCWYLTQCYKNASVTGTVESLILGRWN